MKGVFANGSKGDSKANGLVDDDDEGNDDCDENNVDWLVEESVDGKSVDIWREDAVANGLEELELERDTKSVEFDVGLDEKGLSVEDEEEYNKILVLLQDENADYEMKFWSFCGVLPHVW